MSLDKIEKISKVGQKLHDLQVNPAEMADQAIMKERFEALMREDAQKTSGVTDLTQDPSRTATPMDEARKLGGQTQASKATPTEIVNQTESTVKRIEAVKETLAGGAVEMKPTVQGLLRKKLEHIDENIKTALTKAGATEQDLKAQKEQELVDGLVNPVHRFLGMLTHGQHQLENLSSLVAGMDNRQNVSPSVMLGIQIKVARVQHEIELFTSLLNKALESTKTIMNVQV